MELKTIQDLIKASGFRRTFIYAQIKQGKLPPPLKIGRSSRWKAEDIAQWLNGLADNAERNLSVVPANKPTTEVENG